MRELRFALRGLRNRPLFTAVAVLTLALGIGATSTLFSIVNAVLLRPLPYPDAGRIVSISERQEGKDQLVARVPDYYAWRQAPAFASLAMYGRTSRVIRTGGAPVRFGGMSVSASFFDVFAIRPAIGRVFRPDEDVDGGPDVVVLSDTLWRLLGADPALVGQTLMVDDRPTTVLAVMPPGYAAPRDAFFWLPAQMDSVATAGTIYYTEVAGRLNAGASPAAARSQIGAIIARQSSASGEAARAPVLMSLHDRLFGESRPALLMLLGAVSLLLVIACANVANLFLARGAARQREFAVRVALGASRWRLARQILWESVAIGTLGGVLGLLIPLGALGFFVRISPPSVARVPHIHVDAKVLAFTAAVSVLAGLVFGLIPAYAATAPGTLQTLKEGGGHATAGALHQRIRQGLVVAELTIALAVLTGAGLLTRSLVRATSVDVGFQADHALTLDLYLTRRAFPSGAAVTQFFDQTLREVAGLPGVTGVGYADAPTLGGYRETTRQRLPGGDQSTPIAIERVSAGYMKAMGLELVAGRFIDDRDQAGSERVVVVSEAAAAQLYPGQPVLGKTSFSGAPGSGDATIVGVVRNLQQPGSLDPRLPQLYRPITQAPSSPFTIAIRYQGSPEPLLAAIRTRIRSYDPLRISGAVAPAQDALDGYLTPRRFNAVVIDGFALLALLLAAVGLYGVMAYQVAQRTREFGIRMALGADRGRVLGLVVRGGLGLALLGTACGIALSLGLSRVLAGMLFGVTPSDPPTLVGGSITLIVVTLAACYLPARRATNVDPMVALRHE